jgi:hypothetical protein
MLSGDVCCVFDMEVDSLASFLSEAIESLVSDSLWDRPPCGSRRKPMETYE